MTDSWDELVGAAREIIASGHGAGIIAGVETIMQGQAEIDRLRRELDGALDRISGLELTLEDYMRREDN